MNTRMGYARPAIQTLERLHAELGGKILENKQEHENAGQMRHVEAVIRMLDPGYSLRAISVKRRQSIPWFKRGTILPPRVDVLRTATEPLTAREIAERALTAANVTNTDKDALADRAGASCRPCGIIRASGYSGQTKARRRGGGWKTNRLAGRKGNRAPLENR